MSQNINLFAESFRKRRLLLTLMLVMQCLGITLAALIGYQYYLQQQVDGLAAELAVTEKLLKTQSGFVNNLKDKPVPAVTEAQLDAEIGRLEAEFKLAGESLKALKGGALGSQQGFAEYLRAFSRQSVGGLWLTAFDIGGGGELEIRGRALSPDLLPSFIQRLNRESVLAGRNIARFEMKQPPAEPAADTDKGKGKGKGKGVAKAAPAPRFFEFSLATETSGEEKKP
jgi:Fimbrial assembly protein (PilN)